MNRLWGHFYTITSHKIKVAGLCFRCGLYKQGILHDLSKYSPIEFISGVRYYQGHRSPISKEKEVLGYSKGWLHHKGRNRHHWEYWVDFFRQGMYAVEMPVTSTLKWFVIVLRLQKHILRSLIQIPVLYSILKENREESLCILKL